jgi:hypothetical protein
MFNNTLIHTITVERRTKTGTNVYGEPIYTYGAVYTGIKARVETYNPKVKYTEAGQDGEREIIIYLEANKILQEQDVIKAASVPSYTNGEEVGRVKDVIEALQGLNNQLHHIEIKIEQKHG